jgi:ribosomal protein S18 acetylase RimI-like enzyme
MRDGRQEAVMPITIRTPHDSDFFSWLGVYEGYAKFYDTELTDQRALILWSWLSDAKHEENALIAVDDDADGEIVGLVHFREFSRPLEADRSLFIDDLFVVPDYRGKGVGRSLIDAVTKIGTDKGFGVVQWITAPDNADAQKLYDDVASRTSWVTYEREIGR